MTRDHPWRAAGVGRHACLETRNFRRDGQGRAINRALMFVCLNAAVLLAAGGCANWHRMTDHQTEPQTQTAAERPPVTITPPAAQTPLAKPRRPVHEPPREAPREPERVASVDPNSLIGLAPAAVEKLLGAPSTISKSDPSLVWTYAAQGCSFQVFFYPDIKTASFHALKYASTGGTGDPADNCVRTILTVKSNGPG